MQPPGTNPLEEALADLNPADPKYPTEAVERMLTTARGAGASDLHLLPTSSGLDARLRVDGVLREFARFPAKVAGNIVARLKVCAGLLTYESTMPQEGRI